MSNTPDLKALFKIGYGLYVVTTNDEKKDNGLIVNTVIQVTSTPCRVAVTVNKTNYSHDTIKETGKMIGTCGFTEIYEKRLAAEVGYVLSPSFHRMGLAPEALERVMEYGFMTLGLKKLSGRYSLIGADIE